MLLSPKHALIPILKEQLLTAQSIKFLPSTKLKIRNVNISNPYMFIVLCWSSSLVLAQNKNSGQPLKCKLALEDIKIVIAAAGFFTSGFPSCSHFTGREKLSTNPLIALKCCSLSSSLRSCKANAGFQLSVVKQLQKCLEIFRNIPKYLECLNTQSSNTGYWLGH